jgi:hypothetical protein
MDDLTTPHAPDPEHPVEQVLAYHRLSKHHPQRYAAGPGHLDWANQPDPFRTFAGAGVVELPLLADALSTSYADLYAPIATSPRRADINSVAILLELALGLSAWKEYRESRWPLRCNPSSGNLHPSEGYAVLPALPGLDAGVYYYVSRDHVLEGRRPYSTQEAAHLADGLPAGSFLIGLSSIHWREAWKYGVRYAAATLGWSARLLADLGDDAVSAWLGLLGDQGGWAGVDPLDREHPDALILVGPPPLPTACPRLAPPAADKWAGRANRLSAVHVRWEAIDTVAIATWKPATTPEPGPSLPALPPLLAAQEVLAATLIRQRRSCLALDGRTSLEAPTFYRMLDHLLPRPEVAPWDLLHWAPLVHAAVFVHRVRGLEPGLYLLERSPAAHDELRAACSSTFHWCRPAGCPDHVGFYLLAEADYRGNARTVSCHQDIAADGAFSLGMIAALGPTIETRGPWWYRRLFLEAGVLGQVLYLEAEAAGVRGTGIGCYFDDECHRLLGLTGDVWQDLYHFTVGGPVEDGRLRTVAPYAHLDRR